MKWEETISLRKTMVSRKKLLQANGPAFKKSLTDVTSWATSNSWEQPLNDPCERTPSEEWNGTGSSCPLPASWNSIYSSTPQANLITCITVSSTPNVESLHSSPNILCTSVHILPPLFNAWFGGLESRTSVTLVKIPIYWMLTMASHCRRRLRDIT